MVYRIINDLPIDFYFSDKTKNQLKFYSKWFFCHKDERIDGLIKIVKSTIEFENWEADFTQNSLKHLGYWLNKNIQTEKLSEQEFIRKRKQIPSYIEIKDFDLTTETYSKLIDVGMYFGETFIKSYHDLQWEQYFSKIKNDANQGHMVIKGFGKLELNPLRVAHTIGSKMADKKENDESLYEAFETWKSYLSYPAQKLR